jgi:hypothetical protein
MLLGLLKSQALFYDWVIDEKKRSRIQPNFGFDVSARGWSVQPAGRHGWNGALSAAGWRMIVTEWLKIAS